MVRAAVWWPPDPLPSCSLPLCRLWWARCSWAWQWTREWKVIDVWLLDFTVSQQPHVLFWSQCPFHSYLPGMFFDHLSTLDLSESHSVSEAYFLNCQTPSVVKHTVILCATGKKRLPIKLCHTADCKINSSFRDVKMWKLDMS